MDRMVFIKMKRAEGSLERLLGRIRERGCEVMEMTAKRSLDDSCYFVRMSVQGSSTVEHLKDDLVTVDEIRQVEIEGLPGTAAALA